MGASPIGGTNLNKKKMGKKVKSWTQCRFRKGNSETVAWIDSKAAKVGNKVQLLTLDGEFWEVIGAGGPNKNEPPHHQHKTFKNNI